MLSLIETVVSLFFFYRFLLLLLISTFLFFERVFAGVNVPEYTKFEQVKYNKRLTNEHGSFGG